MLGLAPDADFLKLAAAESKPFFTFATKRKAGLVTIPFRLGLELLKQNTLNFVLIVKK